MRSLEENSTKGEGLEFGLGDSKTASVKDKGTELGGKAQK